MSVEIQRDLNGNGRGSGLPVAFIGTYPPRQCGIATFTRDLSTALHTADGGVEPVIVAMNDAGGPYAYPESVRFQIRQGFRSDYARAADFINQSDIRLVSIQHEHGIFGGDEGVHLLHLLEGLRKPAVATLHTVLRPPSRLQREVIREVADHCQRLVVMSRIAVDLLEEFYGIERRKVRMIPHGIPDMSSGDQDRYKARFGVAGRPMLLTFGLISPVKGLETMIRALPALVERFPDLVYFVVGETHPAIRRRHGEQYRLGLEREAEELGVRDHIVFHNKFVEMEELCEYLQAADIYVTPYLNEAQITSGTLAYAMGAGAAVVSTPYWHARELLAEGRGRLFEFGDHHALARAVDSLLSDRAELGRVRASAYNFSRAMTWPRVGDAYVALVRGVLEEAGTPAPAPAPGWKPGPPELVLDHLLRMTDDTGIIRHATYGVPARRSGYCVDDNARALIVALLMHRHGGGPETERLIATYLGYLHHAQDRDGRFHRFMDYRRVLGANAESEDGTGRALWALGMSIQWGPDEASRLLAKEMFDRAMGVPLDFGPRGRALVMLGLDAYLHAEPSHAHVRVALSSHTAALLQRYRAEADAEWRWFGPELTYDNAMIPLALFKNHAVSGDGEALRVARESLGFLEEICFLEDYLALVGNAGWYRRGGRKAVADEQPIDAAAFVLAFREAYLATGDPHYLRRMRESFEWFLGANRLGISLYDSSTGGCRDGLGTREASRNEGAESVVSFLLARLAMLDLQKERANLVEWQPPGGRWRCPSWSGPASLSQTAARPSATHEDRGEAGTGFPAPCPTLVQKPPESYD